MATKTRKDGKPARAGSGEYQERINLTLDPTAQAIARAAGGGNVSAGVRVALKHYQSTIGGTTK